MIIIHSRYLSGAIKYFYSVNVVLVPLRLALSIFPKRQQDPACERGWVAGGESETPAALAGSPRGEDTGSDVTGSDRAEGGGVLPAVGEVETIIITLLSHCHM